MWLICKDMWCIEKRCFISLGDYYHRRHAPAFSRTKCATRIIAYRKSIQGSICTTFYMSYSGMFVELSGFSTWLFFPTALFEPGYFCICRYLFVASNQTRLKPDVFHIDCLDEAVFFACAIFASISPLRNTVFSHERARPRNLLHPSVQAHFVITFEVTQYKFTFG